tara:strand:- start:3811 stop:4275 length:465 start_codon:yes stop_codon:yes gene_type:complete
MAESKATVEARAVKAGFSILKNLDKKRYISYPTCSSGHCIARVGQEGMVCDGCKTPQQSNDRSDIPPPYRRATNTLTTKSDEKSDEKGRFKGYSKNNISDRPVRQAKNKTWTVSRKNKRGKTARRYKRNKSRGNVRPAMRRQLGAGGSRASTSR